MQRLPTVCCIYLGGFDGAMTEAKSSWLLWLPRMISDTVLIVSVRTSAGTPLAISISHNFPNKPGHGIYKHEDVVMEMISKTMVSVNSLNFRFCYKVVQ